MFKFNDGRIYLAIGSFSWIDFRRGKEKLEKKEATTGLNSDL